MEPEHEMDTERQVFGFKTVKALQKHAQKLKLSRVKISDITEGMDTSSSYIGGQVEGSHAEPYSQGHTLTIFVRDESVSDTQDDSCQLLITIDGDIAEQLPSILSHEFMLFVSGAEVSSLSQLFSQDHSCKVDVKGPNAKVLIVHKNVHKPGFFKQRVCGAAWFEKQKKKKEATKELAVEKTAPTPAEASQDTAKDVGDSSMPGDSESATPAVVPVPSLSVPMPKPKRRKTKENYKYKTLAEVKGGDKKVNIVAVVCDLSEPSPTRGSDVYRLMRLVDESCPNGVKCISFARKPELLPKIRRCGDIISLHRVYVEEYNNCLQIVCNNFCSTLRFSGHVGGSLRPLTSSLTYTLTKDDKNRVKELRAWYQRDRCTVSKLKDVTIDSSFELVCQLIQICENDGCRVLIIWDGTNVSLSLRTQQVPTAKSRAGLVLQALAFGFMHQLVIKDPSLSQTVSTLKPGCILRIKTVTIEQNELCVCGSGCNYIHVVQPTDPVYPQLLASLRRSGEKNTTLSVTTTPNPTAPYITVASLCSRTDVPLKAHLRVKMVCMVTPCLEDMVHLRCSQCGLLSPITMHTALDSDGMALNPCSCCPQSPFPSCSYDFQVAVTDESGEVAILHVTRNEAVKLLGDLAPTNLYCNQHTRYELLRRLYLLTGHNNPFNLLTDKPRPWIECCVLRHLHDGHCYNVVFDTNLEQSLDIDS